MTKNIPHVDRMLPAAEMARSLGLSPQTIRNWIHSGELAAVNVARPGSVRPRYLIRNDDLNRFLGSRKVTAAAG